jgi:peptidyl-prolyl cis-trans isomerase A (cyclophilin A)
MPDMSEQIAGLKRVVVRTALGTIILGIDADAAPITAANFLRYVDGGLFSGSSFFRIVASYNQGGVANKIDVIQGGLSEDLPPPFPPIDHEPTWQTGLRHRDGTLSMARRAIGSAAASFFICVGDQPELDHGGHRHPDGQGFAAFGRVLEGMDVVCAIWRRAESNATLTRPIEIECTALCGYKA